MPKQFKEKPRLLDTRKKVFQMNVRSLAAWLQKPLKEIAEESGLGDRGYRWLRRAVAHGIHSPTQRNVEWVQRLGEYFRRELHVAKVDLWDSQLTRTVVGRELLRSSPTKDEITITDAEIVAMLAELLQVKKYGYLRAVIADLYSASGLVHPGATSRPKPSKLPNKPR